MKGKSVEYRGVIKEEWLDCLWEEIITEHSPRCSGRWCGDCAQPRGEIGTALILSSPMAQIFTFRLSQWSGYGRYCGNKRRRGNSGCESIAPY